MCVCLQVDDNKSESVQLQEKIRILCDRLGHDPGGRERLLASIAGHSPSSLIKVCVCVCSYSMLGEFV